MKTPNKDEFTGTKAGVAVEKSNQIAQLFVDILNEMLELDYEATYNLVEHRVQCTDELADHPTITVGALPDDTTKSRAGLLGVLNGCCKGNHKVAAMFDEDMSLVGFGVRDVGSDFDPSNPQDQVKAFEE